MFRPIFHLAFPVRNLEESKNFYVTTFGAKVGRIHEPTTIGGVSLADLPQSKLRMLLEALDESEFLS